MADIQVWVSLMKDILTAIAAGSAVWGFNAWRRDFVGKRRIELAEETLSLFYQAKDAVATMRGAGAYGFEMEGVVRLPNDSDEKFHWRQTVAPLLKRYDERSDLFGRLQATRYQFMSRFVDHDAKPFDDLRKLINRLLVDARLLVDYADFDDRSSVELHQKMRESIWDRGEGDPIRSQVDDIVAAIEAICRPIIASEGRFMRIQRRLDEWWTAPVGDSRQRSGPT